MTMIHAVLEVASTDVTFCLNIQHCSLDAGSCLYWHQMALWRSAFYSAMFDSRQALNASANFIAITYMKICLH